jgi:ActR/RegA family two-component response regulator
MHAETLSGTIERVVGVLEDEAILSAVLSRQLQVFGFKVIRLRRGPDAVRVAKTQNVRFFVLDVQIGDSSEGLDALEELKELDFNIFVCIYSGYVDRSSYRRRADRLGADFVLPKENLIKDAYLLAKEMLLHERQLNAQALEFLEIELAHIESPRVADSRSGKGKGGQKTRSKSPTRAKTARGLSNDPNIALYLRLSGDTRWLRSHTGKVVGIVDGVLVLEHEDMDRVLAELRSRYPTRQRLVKRVELEEEVLEIPTPFEVEDIDGG